MTDRLASLLEIQALDRIPRLGWIQAGIAEPESVAAHSFGAAFLALVLGPEVSPALDVDRAVSLALVHDVGEARLGDWPRSAARLLPPGVKEDAEQLALQGLLTPLSPLALERASEALERATPEARFARLCDRLQLGVRLLGYVRAGARGLESFTRGLAELDCEGFAPCAEFQRELLGALEELDSR